MWNSNFFEQSDLLTHEMELILCHHLGDCSSDLHTLDIEVMSDLDISNDGDGPLDEHGWQESIKWGTYSQSQSNLIIVTSTGIFKHSVQWCHCTNSLDKYVQLLHARLFPASFKNLQTTFTFDVLDHFQVDVLECKMAAMNFMHKIQQISNEAFPSDVPVGIRLFGWLYHTNDPLQNCYRELLWVSHE